MLHSTFAHGIDQHVGVGDLSLDRRHVDDRAALALFHHLFCGRLIRQEKALHVNLRYLIIGLFVDAQNIALLNNRRIRQHHIEPLPFMDRCAYQGIYARF